MNDWAYFMLTLDDHRKRIDAILTGFDANPVIAPETALEIDAHLDAIVGCCNQVDAWVANHTGE